MSNIEITVRDEDGDPVIVETNEDEGTVEITEVPRETLEAGEEVFTSYTPDQARQLAKALLLAADVLEDVA